MSIPGPDGAEETWLVAFAEALSDEDVEGHVWRGNWLTDPGEEDPGTGMRVIRLVREDAADAADVTAHGWRTSW